MRAFKWFLAGWGTAFVLVYLASGPDWVGAGATAALVLLNAVSLHYRWSEEGT